MISIFKWGEGSHASKMPLGDGFKSLEEGVESNNNTVSTPTNEMAFQADTGPLTEIRFTEGEERRYAEEQWREDHNFACPYVMNAQCLSPKHKGRRRGSLKR